MSVSLYTCIFENAFSSVCSLSPHSALSIVSLHGLSQIGATFAEDPEGTCAALARHYHILYAYEASGQVPSIMCSQGPTGLPLLDSEGSESGHASEEAALFWLSVSASLAIGTLPQSLWSVELESAAIRRVRHRIRDLSLLAGSGSLTSRPRYRLWTPDTPHWDAPRVSLVESAVNGTAAFMLDSRALAPRMYRLYTVRLTGPAVVTLLVSSGDDGSSDTRAGTGVSESLYGAGLPGGRYMVEVAEYMRREQPIGAREGRWRGTGRPKQKPVRVSQCVFVTLCAPLCLSVRTGVSVSVCLSVSVCA